VYKGHEKQLMEGDLCFVYNAPPAGEHIHQVIVADLAKLNEVLATGYYEAKTALSNPGLGLSSVHVNGTSTRQCIQVLNNELTLKIDANTSINQLYNLLKNALYSQKNQDFLFPSSDSIYKKHLRLFPHLQNRYKNVHGKYDYTPSENINHLDIDKEEGTTISDILSTQTSDGKLLLVLADYVLTELLAYNDKYVKYCTLSGVINNWRYYGVVQKDLRGTISGDMMSDYKNGGSGVAPYMNTANFTVAGKGLVINRWGNLLLPTTKLWVIVKKLGPDKPFQFIPWHLQYNTNLPETPSYDDLSYVDEDASTKKIGDKIYIGKVLIQYTDNVSEGSRKIANGIYGDGGKITFERALTEKINLAVPGKIEIML
jgi:hypothetical protein